LVLTLDIKLLNQRNKDYNKTKTALLVTGQGQVKKTWLIKKLMERLLLLMKLILRQLNQLKGKL
jgi:cellobiose-specific phosphotransferase system component IIA